MPRVKIRTINSYTEKAGQNGILRILRGDFPTLKVKRGVWQALSDYLGDTPAVSLTLGYITPNLAILSPRVIQGPGRGVWGILGMDMGDGSWGWVLG